MGLFTSSVDYYNLPKDKKKENIDQVDTLTTQRRPSDNLLDLTDVFNAEPNVNNQPSSQQQQDLSGTIENDNLLTCNKKGNTYNHDGKKPYILDMFDPLREKTVEERQSSKVIPPSTRIPTSRRRPLNRNYVSADNIHKAIHDNDNDSNSSPSSVIQLNPTPPSSPGKRTRHSSIARLVKIQPRDVQIGKANKELAEFDPLLTSSIPPPSSCKKKISSPDEFLLLSAKPKNGQIKQQQQAEKPNTCQQKYYVNTKIPLPVSSIQQSTNRLSNIHIHSNDELKSTADIRNKEDQVLPTKLKRPEVTIPNSMKLASSSDSNVKFQRRLSFSSIVQDQLDKERKKTKKLSVNLISAQGLIINQPNQILSPIHSGHCIVDNIHDQLQSLVDLHPSPVKDNALLTIDNGDHADIINGKTALNRYKAYLSPFEKSEILQYPAVYCVGTNANRKHMATLDEPALNYGFDDEKGDYKIVLKDHINYRYEIIESLGKGSFGQVVKCRDHKLAERESMNNSIVAVKIIRNKKRFYAQAQTEVKILDKIMKWDSKNKHFIVRMLDSFYFRNHLCIVFECLSSNLYDILQQNNYQGFSMGLVKRFAFQILTGLNLLSQYNIIHCDLKPENILLKQPDRSRICIIDFGSSCYLNEKVYTYIQSRFYRAPEVILGLDYNLAIDMWSTGCILAELYTGRPLFPGENEPDQLACIMQLLGVPSHDYLEQCTRKKQFFDSYDKPRKSINSKGKKRKPNTFTFTEALKRSTYDNVDKSFVDFICRCLTWEPEKRMKPIEALNHPWIQSIKKQ
ncbi:kinase-like domain-containing protein [Cokeromyces recurvatus]|uniref:kinase-like domain-containing protein n=1 Tax=Cokeromyces recurvatus TaxID=90255 RepID=UPI0022201BA7|nr:kinase-like domain-containing protein [Cokeromyces recurvatus]KAI7906804.1 kinase-like domain-containing protein [Cokeromyces recurvatus]